MNSAGLKHYIINNIVYRDNDNIIRGLKLLTFVALLITLYEDSVASRPRAITVAFRALHGLTHTLSRGVSVQNNAYYTQMRAMYI